MKAGLITLIVLVLAASLSGCGQKGPLYRDAPVQKIADEAASATATESEAGRANADDR